MFLSFFIVAFGQPAWVGWLGIVASCCGYAIFWHGTLRFKEKKSRFWIGTIWFSCTQMVQLSWLISNEYVPLYASIVYLLFIFVLGAQFGVLTLLIPKDKKLSLNRILLIASFWVLMEWIRLFIGFPWTWNPAGIAMSNSYAEQMVSLVGVYGLSFVVMVVNLLALRIFYNPRLKMRWLTFAVVALVPYLYGFCSLRYHDNRDSEKISVLLVQTALSPEQKEGISLGRNNKFILPIDQWKRILKFISNQEKTDLIVLPEDAIPFGMSFQFSLKMAIKTLEESFGSFVLPPLEVPFFRDGLVSNAFFAQAIANHYDADLIAGFGYSLHNSAFLFQGGRSELDRYDKRILVPMGEYVPKVFGKIAARFGMLESYYPGKEAKVFSGKKKYCPSICYEETYGHLMREGRQLGADLYVNITNDGWFPNSRLPQQHFFHGRLRAVENGVPLIRACNTGITAAVDSFGRTTSIFGSGKKDSEWRSGALFFDLSTYHYRTLYSIFGDWLIICFCFFIVICNITKRRIL